MDLLEHLELKHLEGDQLKLATTIGIEAYKKLVGLYAGAVLYVPTVDTLTRKIRDEIIKSEYTGYNQRELAVKYGFSEQWIREIVGPSKPPLPGQASMFDQEAI